MSASTPIVVSVIRNFPVPRERVFDAWLDPALIEGWMFGAAVRNEEILHLRNDPRVGGRFSFLVQRGEQRIDHVGTYLELDRPRRLAFTWAAVLVGADEDVDEASSRVTIELIAAGDGCDLTLTHEMDPKWADYAERTRMGWTKMLGDLADALEKRPG